MIIQISKLHTIVSYKLNNMASFGGFLVFESYIENDSNLDWH